MKDTVLGFLGLGTMGFCMAHGLVKAGHKVILPTFRRDIDQTSGFSALVPDAATKTAKYDELLADTAESSTDMKDLISRSSVILISMPTSAQVESLVLSDDGILNNAKPGSIVIDLTSAAPSSTRKLSKMLEKRGVEMIDSPVSGGTKGAIAQNLTLMVGGKEEVFEKCRAILEVIGAPEQIYYVGPSGAGDTIKCANNYLSACCTAATTEAVMVAAKAGISPELAIKIIANSGGKSDASMRKYPQRIFKGDSFTFTLSLMCKDIALFNQAAQDHQVPAFVSNIVYQLWNLPMMELGGDKDCINFIKMYEKWCDVKVCGITADE